MTSKTIKARIQVTRKVYIHNDLSDAAFYLKDVIEKKLSEGTRDAIMFDCMACITMLAFSFEAYLNFFGHKLVPSWNERQSMEKKTRQVFNTLNLSINRSKRPYSAIETLREVRDILAHGKPVEEEIDEIVEATIGELDVHRVSLRDEWETLCTPEVVLQAYCDLDIVWKEMLEKSGIEIFDTMSHGERGISLVSE